MTSSRAALPHIGRVPSRRDWNGTKRRPHQIHVNPPVSLFDTTGVSLEQRPAGGSRIIGSA